jgi:hypothetical protein
MSLLWSLINVMQLIVNLPLLNVQFPANAVKFYSFLDQMANFDLIPETWIMAVRSALFS